MSADRRDSASVLMAMVAGAGFLLLMLAFFLGAVGGANDQALNLFFLLGVFLLLVGFVSWLFHRQPFRHFDDINRPLEEEAH